MEEEELIVSPIIPIEDPDAPKRAVNFRHTPEIETFYRFISDNDLRREAKIIIDQVYDRLAAANKKRKKAAKKSKKAT